MGNVCHCVCLCLSPLDALCNGPQWHRPTQQTWWSLTGHGAVAVTFHDIFSVVKEIGARLTGITGSCIWQLCKKSSIPSRSWIVLQPETAPAILSLVTSEETRKLRDLYSAQATFGGRAAAATTTWGKKIPSDDFFDDELVHLPVPIMHQWHLSIADTMRALFLWPSVSAAPKELVPQIFKCNLFLELCV